MGRGRLVLQHDLFTTKQSELSRLTADNAMTQFGSDGSKLGLELVEVGSKAALQNSRTVVNSQDMGSLVSRLDGKQLTDVN